MQDVTIVDTLDMVSGVGELHLLVFVIIQECRTVMMTKRFSIVSEIEMPQKTKLYERIFE